MNQFCVKLDLSP